MQAQRAIHCPGFRWSGNFTKLLLQQTGTRVGSPDSPEFRELTVRLTRAYRDAIGRFASSPSPRWQANGKRISPLWPCFCVMCAGKSRSPHLTDQHYQRFLHTTIKFRVPTTGSKQSLDCKSLSTYRVSQLVSPTERSIQQGCMLDQAQGGCQKSQLYKEGGKVLLQQSNNNTKKVFKKKISGIWGVLSSQKWKNKAGVLWAIGKMATQDHYIRIEWANLQVYVFCDAPIHNPPNFHIVLYMYSSLEEPNTTAAGWRHERFQTHPISHPWRKPCISIWFRFFFSFSRRDPQEVLLTLLSQGRCKLSRSLLQRQSNYLSIYIYKLLLLLGGGEFLKVVHPVPLGSQSSSLLHQSSESIPWLLRRNQLVVQVVRRILKIVRNFLLSMIRNRRWTDKGYHWNWSLCMLDLKCNVSWRVKNRAIEIVHPFFYETLDFIEKQKRFRV